MTAGRILQVIAPQHFGGAESVVLSLALAQQQAGGSSEVVALIQGRTSHPFVERAEALGIPVTQIACGRRRYLAEVASLRQLIAGRVPSVVHTHLVHADVVGLRAARSTRTPLVSTVHGITGQGWKNALYVWFGFRTLRRFDAVVGVSSDLSRRLRNEGISEKRIHHVPNAYQVTNLLERSDARAKLGLPLQGQVVGWVGRLSNEKGPDLFLEAVEPLCRGGATAAFIGEGPERQMLEERVASRQMADRIRFVGARDEAAKFLPAFDVLVVSSRSEACPMIVLEAMAARVPIAAFAVGDIPDILDEGTAEIVEPTDSVELRAAIGRLLDQPVRAKAQAEAAWEQLQRHFGPSDWVQAMELVYENAIMARGRA